MERNTRSAMKLNSGVAGNRNTADLVLQWGNRKRLRYIKVQLQDQDTSSNGKAIDPFVTKPVQTARIDRPACPAPRIRNSDRRRSIGMRRKDTNSVRGSGSPTTNNSHQQLQSNKGWMSENKKGGFEYCHWPASRIEIGLTHKEKEEDFLAIKGSKLPHRPKKRPKLIQRYLNLVSPGSWLCDLSVERYEVREKKVSKKKVRGLKDMESMDSDSE